MGEAEEKYKLCKNLKYLDCPTPGNGLFQSIYILNIERFKQNMHSAFIYKAFKIINPSI
jgi:hypothetical protein